MAKAQDTGSKINYGFVLDNLDDPKHDGLEQPPVHFLPRVNIGNKPSPPDNNGNQTPRESISTDPDDESRDTWANPIEFLLSCISMSVGLGNVWRFPGVAARNGGGAFLIPYLCVLLLIGRPLYYLELCLGQFSRFGQVKCWNMAPILRGVGFGTMTGAVSLVSYYTLLLAITIRFFFSSFAKDLPWSVCHQDKHPHIPCNGSEGSYASLFYQYTVFPQRANIDDGLGDINWQIALCMVASWMIIFASLVQGVKSSGKVAYFTAIFPYVVLIILLIRGVTLPGAWKGIKVFLTPDWGEIVKPKVWYAAVEQCFFSLGIGFGPIIMFSSYNPFNHNVYKDALIVSFMDTGTSILAGITVFSVIGNMMHVNNLEFDQVDGVGGTGLAFVLYPQTIASFDWVPQLFAVLFFLMFFTLGLGTATPFVGCFITMICDEFPSLKRWMVTLAACILGCLVGMMYVTEGGMFMLDLIDHFGSGFVIYLMVIIECVGVSYVYGLNNFCNDIEFMLGRSVGIYWRICWAFIMPVGLFANLLYYLISEGEFESGGVPYPKIATICGWLLTGFAVSMIPILAVYSISKAEGSSLIEKIRATLEPTKLWGPQAPKLRRDWEDFKATKATSGNHNSNCLPCLPIQVDMLTGLC